MGVKVLVTSMIKLTECSVLITKAFMTSSWNTKTITFFPGSEGKGLVMVGCMQRKNLWWWGASRERTCDGGVRAEKGLVMVGVHGGNVSCWDLLEDSGACINHPPPHTTPPVTVWWQWCTPISSPRKWRGYMSWCRFGADMYKLHPSVLQWLDRDSNYLTERWSRHSLCRRKQVCTVWQLVNWITHGWLELTFHQATDTKIQYTQCSGQSKLHRYLSRTVNPDDISTRNNHLSTSHGALKALPHSAFAGENLLEMDGKFA